MKLIIVESPTKANTISKFLADDFIVRSSYGHIRDLPKNTLGVNIEKGFEPKYIIPLKAKKKVNELKKYAKETQRVILATDEDREGEAIAWHITQVLGLDKSQVPNTKNQDSKNYDRIVFHEITKSAIKAALQNPRIIDMNLVNAQQSRRILDRLVGYNLSPFLWKKVKRGLSAGRVQSIAVRLICEREKEIEIFKPEEYWTVVATLLKIKNQNEKIKDTKDIFEAILYKKDDKFIPKLGIKTKEEADKIIKDLKNNEYKVKNIQKEEKLQNPLPPFITSSLQQESWIKLHYPAKFTMRIAQALYEKGFITYHRSDSFNLSDTSLFFAKKIIEEKYGKEYWAGFKRRYKTKSKVAQEAHEAIRPTRPDFIPKNLGGQARFSDKNEEKMYELIWRRFIATQMAAARIESISVEIETQSPKSQKLNSKQIPNFKFQVPNYTFKTNGQTIKFDGFLKIYPLSIKEKILPVLETKELLKLLKLTPLQHFTKPPSRYSEATLVKTLESYGIGRPSTYALIISTIQERGYVEKDEKKKLKPTEIGILVNDLLVKYFPEIIDINFTAKIEKELDEIANGKIEWQKPLQEFYFPFEKKLKKREKEVKKQDLTKKTNKKCPNCNSFLLLKWGRFGRFYACSKFPECKYTKQYYESIGISCPKCQKGEIKEIKTKKNKRFYGCSRFPECDFISWKKPKNSL